MKHKFYLTLVLFSIYGGANTKNTLMQNQKDVRVKDLLKKAKKENLVFETVLNSSVENVWMEVCKVQFWIDVMGPEARLKTIEKAEPPEYWKEGVEYQFKLRMYQVIPFGKHYIEFETIDASQYKLQTREHGFMVPHWDNTFEVKYVNDSTCLVRDELFISSNGIDGVVRSYAKQVFKAKHRRLKSFFDSLVLDLFS